MDVNIFKIQFHLIFLNIGLDFGFLYIFFKMLIWHVSVYLYILSTQNVNLLFN